MSDQFHGIQVTGTGKVNVKPTRAIISLGVVSEDKKASTALTANSLKMKEVFKVLKQAGVDDKDIQTDQFTVSPQWKHSKTGVPTPTGYYSAANNVHVKVWNLDDLGKMLDACVQSGANSVDGISFEAEKPEQASAQALKAAVADAKSKAALIAESEGVRLGMLVSAVEQFRQPARTRGSVMLQSAQADVGGGSAPVSAGELELVVTVTAVYAVGGAAE